MLCVIPYLGITSPAHAGEGVSWDSIFSAPKTVQRPAPGNALTAELAKLLKESQKLSDDAKVKAVNRFFNTNIRYASDKEIWGVEDYWATPEELLEKGAGDCEDYAIAKYFALLQLGISDSRLKMVYVRHRDVDAHMVLTYQKDASTDLLILDNLIPEILPTSKRPDLTPVYAFNLSRMLIFNPEHKWVEKNLFRTSTDISLWTRLLEKMQ